jgi:hypothetical protein
VGSGLASQSVAQPSRSRIRRFGEED